MSFYVWVSVGGFLWVSSMVGFEGGFLWWVSVGVCGWFGG